jgi:REP element-mobilizing transposase RayT
MTTNEYIHGVKNLGWMEFAGRVWQRNYYEHIIRGEEDNSRIREYILQNPRGWPDDEENPARATVR